MGAADPKAEASLDENEKAIKFADLRIALGACRDLQAKFKADVDPILAKLIPGSIVVVNTDVCSSKPDPARTTVVEVAANEIADGIGNRLAASMVLTGAYAAATGLVSLDALAEGISASLPSYRQKTVDVNVAALRAGFETAPRDLVAAWPAEVGA